MDDEAVTMEDSFKNILGDPKRSLFLMSTPIAVALLVQYLNSVVDMFWVSGLGADALAAVSIVTPIYSVIISIGNGIGIGASYAISKHIGARHRKSASDASSQSLVLTLIAGVASIFVLLLIVEPLMIYMGAESILGLCKDYALPIIITSPLLMMGGIFAGSLRGEGAANRAMIILGIAAISNMVLDPILIYSLGMGISGAAYATVLSATISMLPVVYWYLVKKDILIPIILKGFRFLRKEVRFISEVGLPQTIELVFMSLMSVFFVRSISYAGGTDLVAVFEITWRIALILMVPAQAIGTALVPILSASCGMKDNDRVKNAFNYGLKVSLILMVALAVITFLLAPYIAQLMTLSVDSIRLRSSITEMLIVCTLFFPAFSLIHASSSLLQSMGRGTTSLILTVVRNAAIAVAYAALSIYSIASYMWWGMTICEIVFGIITLFVAILFFKKYCAPKTI